jgi:hypothetical protein
MIRIYDEGQLAEAVAAYALTAAGIAGADSFWPFPVHSFRPTCLAVTCPGRCADREDRADRPAGDDA